MQIKPVNVQRRGFCPGLWTPMESGDGLIVRLHAGFSGLRSVQLGRVAELARVHGNGQIEVTRRGNLQLRGIAESSLSRLQSSLVRLGLGAATPAAEIARALVVHPLAELDPAANAVAPLARELERVLIDFDRAASLPAKFAIALDLEGQGAQLRRLRADLRIELSNDHARLIVAADGGGSNLGRCLVEDASAIVRVFLEALAEQPSLRLRELFAADGGGRLRALAGDRLLAPDVAPLASRTRSLIGFHEGLRPWFGFGVPFGSGSASDWCAIAALADRFGDGTIRLTTGRGVLLPGVSREWVALHEAARRYGFLVDPADRLLRVIACPGAPACGSAWGETRALARRLSLQLLPEHTLHVSGCSKGCASSEAADITIVHAADGCKLGFGLDVAQTSLAPADSIEATDRALTSSIPQ